MASVEGAPKTETAPSNVRAMSANPPPPTNTAGADDAVAEDTPTGGDEGGTHPVPQREKESAAVVTAATAIPSNKEDEGEGEDMMVGGSEDDSEDEDLNAGTKPGSDGGSADDLANLAAMMTGGAGDGASGKRGPKRRPLRCAAEITQEELSSCFHLPSEAACRKLGIGLTVLKRQCRKFGIKRWPFRKMKSLDRLITNVQAGISPGDQNLMLVKSVEELEEQKRRMEECQVLDLDENTKRLQQAYSKANHKARRMAQAPELNGLGGLLALGAMNGAPGAGDSAKLPASATSLGSVLGGPGVNNVLEAARAEMLQGVVASLPGLLPGALDSNRVNMAAAVAAAAAAISGQDGSANAAAAHAINMNAKQLQHEAMAANLAAVLGQNQQMSNMAALSALIQNAGLAGLGADLRGLHGLNAGAVPMSMPPVHGGNLGAVASILANQGQVVGGRGGPRKGSAATGRASASSTPAVKKAAAALVASAAGVDASAAGSANPFAPPNASCADPGGTHGEDDDDVKPVHAVSGVWSPARPAQARADRSDGGGKEAERDGGADVLDELLAGKRSRQDVFDDEDEDEEDVPVGGRGRRQKSAPRHLVEQRAGGGRGRGGRGRGGRGRGGSTSTSGSKEDEKEEKEDEDPLASLAAAALAATGGSGGRGRKGRQGDGRGLGGVGQARGSVVLASSQGSIGGARVRGSAVHAEHPAFALAQRPQALRVRASHRGDKALPQVDKQSITLLVTDHADRLRQAMYDLQAEKDSSLNKQAISDAIGAESLKLRDALNALLLP